jgi:amino acid permease
MSMAVTAEPMESRSESSADHAASEGFLGVFDREEPDPAVETLANPDDDTISEELAGSLVRVGTTASARFNILSTMVGGGSLSLPMAFQKAGNGLLGPVILIVVATVTEFCFRILVDSARRLSPVSASSVTPGKDSFELIASAAFGRRAYVGSMILVTFMCFFGTIGYAVLLRDMLEPVTFMIFPSHSDASFSNTTRVYESQWESVGRGSQVGGSDGPSWRNNATMLIVVLLVTPLCTLRTLTALKRFGAASMVSVLILGLCVVYRSIECNLGYVDGNHDYKFWHSFQLWPDSWKNVLDAFPLFVSCFVCHYNILTVHNELRVPSHQRVSWWLRSTTWMAAAFYLLIGLAGSAYGHCTVDGKIHGNVLLDFPKDDPLLLVGRMCLALTITLAFPMLTIPARDIVIRSLPSLLKHDQQSNGADNGESNLVEQSLRQSLLENVHSDDEAVGLVPHSSLSSEQPSGKGASFWLRLVVAMALFWTAAGVASCVSSIDIVWNLLGSSLSMLLSYIIPCSSYLTIIHTEENGGTSERPSRFVLATAWVLLLVASPLMILSTANAVYSTFFSNV